MSFVRPALILAMLALTATIADAATIEIFPSNADASGNEEFETRVNALAPGDVLILHGGIYTQTCRRAITVNGTPTNPITIRAADGETPIITRPQPANFSYDHNNIEIVNSSHLIIRGLHFKGGDGGISFNGGHHITFEGNEVYETGNNALRMNSGNTDSFIIRGNHIHHTRGTGSGGNDGIEAKAGSYNVTVRNNVIHDTIIGNHYPCIFVYGGGAGSTWSKATSCGIAARPFRSSPTRSSGTTSS